MLKNSLLLFFTTLLTLAITVFGFLWFARQNTQLLKPFFPKTQFSVDKAPSDSLVGNVSSISGNVVFLSRTAISPTPVYSTQKLQQGEEVDTKDGTATISFDNVGEFALGQNTQINIIQTLPANLVVEQKQGTAIYNITGENIPFSVRGLDLLINLNNANCAITVNPDTSKITLTVKTGSATLAYTDIQNNSNVVTVNKGEEIIFNNNTKLYSFL